MKTEELLNKSLDNKDIAIECMYKLWNLGIANNDMMDEIRARIDERYANAKYDSDPF